MASTATLPNYAQATGTHNSTLPSDHKDSSTFGNTPASKVINVLILGETANGKSTLVKHLGTYSGVENHDVKVGFGNTSCTKEVGSHPLSTTLHAYQLNDPSGHPIKGVPYSELAMFTDDAAVMVKGQPEQDGEKFHFNLIDTPGLNDSDGNDMSIMTDILGRVGELPHLNAIIYVRSMTNPFNRSFQVFYDYLRRSMPVIANGLIVVHSNYSVDGVQDALERRRRNWAEERREAFQSVTKGTVNLPHFFMDNDPDTSNPFAMMESLNACFRLLKLLATQLPLQVDNLRLLKTQNMLNIDAAVIVALQRVQNRRKRQLEDDMARTSRSKAKALRVRREMSRLEARIADDEAQVEDMDRDSEIVLGTKTVAEDYCLEALVLEGSLRLDKRDVSFDADCIIARVSKSTSGSCRWLDEDRRGTTWRATLKASMFRSMNGSATFYTTSRLKHQREIDVLRMRAREARQSLHFLTEELKDEDELGAAETGTAKLSADVERGEALIERLQRDTFDAMLWTLLRQFYVVDRALTEREVIDFVSVYDPEVAKYMAGA